MSGLRHLAYRVDRYFRKNTLSRLRRELREQRHEYDLEREAAFVEAQRHRAAAEFYTRKASFLTGVVDSIDDQLGELVAASPSLPPTDQRTP